MPKASKVSGKPLSGISQWIASFKDKELVNKTNRLLKDAKDDINEFEIPIFGSSLYAGDDTSCVFHDADSIIASVVADRFIRKFEQPSNSMEHYLKRKCFGDWSDFEQSHLSTVQSNVGTDRETQRSIIRCRSMVRRWLSPKKGGHQKTFWDYLEDAPLDFGPGESFITSRGDTSVYSKLAPSQVFPNGTVTIDAAEIAAMVIASNKATRDCYWQVLKDLPRYTAKCSEPPCETSIIEAAKRFDNYFKADVRQNKRVFVLARRIYSEIFYAYPVDHPDSLVQRGSRASSVYKDSSKRRFINIECLWNSVIQKMIGWSIRQCLLHNAKIDLDDGQHYHRYLISKGVSTLDESNASDSIVHAYLKEVLSFDRRLFKAISLTRSEFILMDEFYPTQTGFFQKQKLWNKVIKTSSMGNGYTFEILSLILGALVRYHDNQGSVYGDDIICRNECAADIVSDIRAAGFLVNEKKSFIAKPFRESCGAFFLEKRGYITCFDIKWCHSVHDVIKTVNKFGRIVEMNKGWKHPLLDRLVTLHNDLLALVPAFLRGPKVHELSDLPEWVEDETFMKRQRGSQICKDLWARHSKSANMLTHQWKLVDHMRADQCNTSSEWGVCLLPTPVLSIKIRRKYAGLHAHSALMYSYIYSARVSDMLIRQQTNELVWEYKTTLVHSSGLAIRAQRASEITVPFDPNKHKKDVIRSSLRKRKVVNVLAKIS